MPCIRVVLSLSNLLEESGEQLASCVQVPSGGLDFGILGTRFRGKGGSIRWRPGQDWAGQNVPDTSAGYRANRNPRAASDTGKILIRFLLIGQTEDQYRTIRRFLSSDLGVLLQYTHTLHDLSLQYRISKSFVARSNQRYLYGRL